MPQRPAPSPRSGPFAALAAWAPEPVSSTGTVGAWPVAAFSALLDLPEPVAREGEPLPPLWHWFHLLDHPRRSELGADGHAAAGPFMPPIRNRRRMIAGGRLQLHAPIRVGAVITRRSRLQAVEVKRGRSGQLAFVTVRHDLVGDGELLAVEEQDVVYRSQPAGTGRAPAGAGAGTPGGPGAGGPGAGSASGTQDASGAQDVPALTLALPTDAATLFRFSALTYNTHRIHYDQDYVTTVEGYPGLVVHGPLLALLLLEIPRRFAPGRAVRSFGYRLRRPLFAGTTVQVTGTPDGDGLALRAAGAGEPPGVVPAAVGSLTLTP